MRIPMVSALCLAFVSAWFPHPAPAQVNSGDLKSFQAPGPTAPEQIAPGLRANFTDQQDFRTWGKLLTGPRPGGPGWQQFGTPPEVEQCAQCAHIQVYENSPDMDPKIIVERIPGRLLPLRQLVPLSDPDIPIYHGLPPCPKDFRRFLPIHP